MAKVTYVDVDPPLQTAYDTALKSSDRYVGSTIRRNPIFSSIRRKKNLTQKSLLPVITVAWNGLTSTQRTAWDTAAAFNSMNGFRLFVQEYVACYLNALTLPPTPDNEAQYLVGQMALSGSATAILLEQQHPFTYYVLRKVHGTRNQYEPILITENFSLPLTLGISWHTNLTASGGSPRARVYIEVISNYQGIDLTTVLEIPFGLTDAWQSDSVSLSSVVGIPRGYTVFLELFDVQGYCRVDNLNVEHSGQNWARDFRFNEMRRSFTRAFYQVARNWAAITIPLGAGYDSIYRGL